MINEEIVNRMLANARNGISNKDVALREGAYVIMELVARAEKAESERNAAIKTIFQWVGCPECKHWNSTDSWCKKHDREAGVSSGCSTPEWKGINGE